MNSAERRRLIYATQERVLKNEEMRFAETSSFLSELINSFQESFEVIKDEAMELASRVEFDEDLGLQYRVEWLNQLKSNLNKVTTQIASGITDSSMEHFINTYTNQFNDNGNLFGISTSFIMPSIHSIVEAINYPWSDKMWSDRVWVNTQKLNNEINRLIVRGLMTGESNQAIAKLIDRDLVRVQEHFKYVTERLIRTETARVQYVADVKCWEELGVKEVRFLSFMDSKTSDYCREHNGKKYELGKEPKLPAHPHCRSCYVPVIDEDIDWMERLEEAKNRANGGQVKIETPKGEKTSKESKPKSTKKKSPKLKPIMYTEQAVAEKDEYGDLTVTVRNTKYFLKEDDEKYIKQYNKIKTKEDFEKYIEKMNKKKNLSYSMKEFLKEMVTVHDKRDSIFIPEGYTYAITRGDVSNLEKKLHKSGFFSELTSAEMKAITAYTGSDYADINGFLRGLQKSVSKSIKDKIIPNLTEGLGKGSLEVNTVLFRGANIDMFDNDFIDRLMGNPESVVGETFMDKGFMSTSISPMSAFTKNITLQILAPQGTEGAYVKDYSKYKNENEFLLQRGTELRILKVERGKTDLHYTMVCEVINQSK